MDCLRVDRNLLIKDLTCTISRNTHPVVCQSDKGLENDAEPK
jgi:hypothetical protein